MSTNPQQQKLFALLKKINDAIEDGHFAAPLKKLTELNAKFPRQSTVLMLMGKANAKRGRHPEAISFYGQAVDCNPKSADARFDFAHALQIGGKYDQALLEYERALYYTPNHFLALRHKCSVLTDLDRTEEALKVWNTLNTIADKDNFETNKRLAIAISGARLAPKVIDAIEAIVDIKKYIEDDSCSNELRIAGYWQIGRLNEKLELHDDAFEAYKNSKDIKKAEWDPDEHSARIDRLIGCWTGGHNIPYSSIDGSRLIFIVGMMRSGTSLTEQMISQVQVVTPGGEMNAVSRQFTPLDRPEGRYQPPLPYTSSVYTKRVIEKMSKDAMVYYNEVTRTGYVTDKQPYNNTNVPLIAHMFPGCKIIHCVREPMDCLLSNYTQAFARPHMQTHDLYWLGRYFRDYKRMMQAWHTVDEVDMIDLHYEKLVAEPEAESKRVMEFLGIQWTEDILNFHQSTRTVSTASRDQVRQPMYTSSVQKYKKYEHHLSELKRGLGIEG